jgi:hypothetical protein
MDHLAHYFPEDRTLHNHCCQNIRSYMWTFVCKTQRIILLIIAMKVLFIPNILSWQLLFLNKASALWVWCLSLEVKKDMSQIRDEEACLSAKVMMLCIMFPVSQFSYSHGYVNGMNGRRHQVLGKQSMSLSTTALGLNHVEKLANAHLKYCHAYVCDYRWGFG